MDDMGQIEHRRSRRVRMKQALRVRPLDPKDGSFEELGTTKDFSQGGVYFVTQREVYYEGMRLSVTVPYSQRSQYLQVRQTPKPHRSKDGRNSRTVHL
jgi:hypothetical protein